MVSNKKYSLYAENKIEVYCHILANKLNKLLNTFPDYRFKRGVDEPVFKFSNEERDKVVSMLKKQSAL